MKIVRPFCAFFVALVCAAILALLPVGHVRGQSLWTNPGTGFWQTASNWTPGVPNSGVDAQINNGGTAWLFNDSGQTRDIFLGRSSSSSSGSLLVQGFLGGVGSLNSQITEIGVLGSGTATVDGADSTWTNIGLIVGFQGTGTLSITNGGAASSSVGLMGNLIGSHGIVTVSGTGSTWTSNSLVVGVEGTAILSIENGGLVIVGGGDGIVKLAEFGSGSVGTLRIGNGGAAGTLQADAVTGETGVARVVFNHTNASYSFLPQLTGGLRVDHSGLGKTVLTDPDFYTGDTFVLAGTLRIEGGFVGGRNVTVSGGNFDVHGGLTVGPGTIRLDGGAITADSITMAGGVFDFVGGSLHAGLINGNLTNQAGTLAPGSSAGSTTIIGNYTQQAGASLQIEIGGPLVASDYDFVNVTGTALLSGQLKLALTDGYLPTSTDIFTIMNSGSLLSFFSNVTNNQRLTTVDGNGSFLVHYGPTSTFNHNQIVLTNFQLVGLPGDFNHDGTVGAADYVMWRKGVGIAPTPENYNLWRANFGRPPGSGSGVSANATVPEPSSLVTLIVGVFAMFARRRAAVS